MTKIIELPESTDEVTYTDYRKACERLIVHAAGLLNAADPDEAAEHYLPLVTQHIAIIFAYVGANMTARHTARYAATVAALQAAKSPDVTSAPKAGTLPNNPTS